MSLIKQVEVSDVEFAVVFTYTPYKPGKFTGPWEDSYPDEPADLELEGVYLHLSPACHDVDLTCVLSDKVLDKITEKLLDMMESGDE